MLLIACGGRIAPERGDGDTSAQGAQAPEPVTPEPASKSATATAAQRALADAFCHTCVADEPAPDCVDATLRHVGPGETIGVAILALSDSGAMEGLSCASETRATNQPTPFLCEDAFITCLARYRPIVGP